MNVQSLVNRLGIEIDNYQQTVLALRSLANEILFDESTRTLRATGSAHCGRQFVTSAANRHSPSTDVHPDLAVLQTAAYGVIAEAKLGFDSDPVGFKRRIAEVVEQLEKYDDDLSGWPGRSDQANATFVQDLALVVNFEDARRAVRKLEELIKNGQLTLIRQLAIVSIARLGRSDGEWPTLALEHGKLSDAAKTQKLDNRIPIRPEILDASPVFGQVCLYDHEPPVPLMMYLVHEAIVSNLTADESEQYNLEGQIDKEVHLAQLQVWLRLYAFKKADARDPAIPKPEWIKRSVTRLVDMDWASRSLGKGDRFIYHHKKGRRGCGNPLGRFTEAYAKHLHETEEKENKKKAREEQRESKLRESLKKKAPLFADQIDLEHGTGREKGTAPKEEIDRGPSVGPET